MALNKNGLGHRPFGSWALEEDSLEEEAARLAKAAQHPNEKKLPAASVSDDVKKS